MNISTGGPHILLFERDQQLAALLMSELQLAGYEGHIARTAVEVFDAIARYPVRLVLVNLTRLPQHGVSSGLPLIRSDVGVISRFLPFTVLILLDMGRVISRNTS